jgi:hypothetical protein
MPAASGIAPPAHPKRSHSVPVLRSVPTSSPTPAVDRPQIDQLIGLDETGIRTVFGIPASEEDHAPTKRWVYRVRQCTMNVTFYPEVETRQFHALNYEVNSDDGSAKRQQTCVAEFSSRLPAKPIAK